MTISLIPLHRFWSFYLNCPSQIWQQPIIGVQSFNSQHNILCFFHLCLLVLNNQYWVILFDVNSNSVCNTKTFCLCVHKKRAYPVLNATAAAGCWNPAHCLCIGLSAASRKCQTVCHALKCGSQCSGNNWAKKNTEAKAQFKGGTSIKAVLFFSSLHPLTTGL